MKLRKAVFEVVGIRPGEGRPVGWLVAHSLCVGVFSAFFLTAANALFLHRFEASYLPVAYIAAGLVGYLALMLFARMQRALSLQRTLLVNLALLLLVAAALWLLVLATDARWVSFAMFVWVGPAFSLLALGYWTLAGRLLDLRQGKRLFGLVGAGEEVATVAGLFSVPLLMRWLGGPQHLLPIALVGLAGCLAVVLATARRFREALSEPAGDPAAPEAGEPARSGLRALLRDRYFLLLAALVVCLNLANYVVDFAFLGQVRGRFQGSAQLAQFIAVFFGATKTLELLAKVFLSGRLLGQFGLGFGLLAVPVLLAACALLAVAIGAAGLPAAHFFVLVALAKLVWIVSRTSTFEPAFRVLYQPVGAERLAFQTHAEGTARQIAIGVVGVALLLWSRRPSFEALNLFYALLPLLALWGVVSVLAHREYRARLLASLTARRRQVPPKPLDLLREDLLSPDPGRQQHAFSLLQRIEGPAFGPRLGELLADPEPKLRVAALEHVGRERLAELQEWAAGCLSAGEDEVRVAARRALDRLAEIERIEPERVDTLATSADPTERILGAEAIGRGGGPSGDRLWTLLFDPELAVRRAALVAAGRLGRPEFWPQLIGELGSPVLSRPAIEALLAVGERVLPEAERAFHRPDQQPVVRQRLLRVYETMDGARANALLVEKLDFPDEAVRSHALAALVRGGYRVEGPQAATVARAIESLVGRSAWNMAAVLDLGEDPRLVPVVHALEEEIESARTNLFQMLSLVHDPWAIGLVRENLERGSKETSVYALEILDLVLPEEMKPLVFPILEDLGYAQALRRLEAVCPRHRMAPPDRLAAIINREYDRIGGWTRICAIEALGSLSGAVVPELVATLFHPEPLIQDAAAFSLRQLDPDAYARHRTRLDYAARARLDYVMGPDDTRAHWSSRSALGRSRLLKELPVFTHLPSASIVRLALASDDLVLNERRRLPSPRAPRESFYLNLDGVVALISEPPSPALPHRSLIGFGADGRAVEVRQAARFVRIDPDPLFELAAEHVELIRELQRAEAQQFETAPSEVSAPS